MVALPGVRDCLEGGCEAEAVGSGGEGCIPPKAAASVLWFMSPGVPHTELDGGTQGMGLGVRGSERWGRGAGLGPHSSAVDWGMRSGILESFRLVHSTTLASQRHLWGQATSLLHSLFSW